MVRSGAIFTVFLVVFLTGCEQEPSRVDFSTQIKPIINKNCISCHGGVKRNSGFSLLFHQDALDTAESGKPAIIPGDPDHSELITRLGLSDPEERMPYKEEPLKKEEVDLLRQWIKEGATWGDHWAYVAPKPVEVPKPSRLFSGLFGGGWEKNEIDYFVRAALDEQGMKPADEAAKSVLMRRAYLDLIGIPPTPEQAQEFLSDPDENAYEKLVDKLLGSPRFGEKWASWWLDMARYSDTKGYERDASRNIWRYRDWVIKAFNEDKPYDQFTIEQLAGDLLPNPTDDQFIATAFHRNTMNNDEGGTEDEEFRVAAVIDRVNTTMEVWQSTTIGCVQCHSHPYDPFRNEEYYKLMAFFNDTRDEDTEGEHPNLRFFKEPDQEKLEAIRSWVKQNTGEENAKSVEKFLRTLEPKIHPHEFDKFVNGELIDTKWLGIRHGGSARLPHINMTNKSTLIMNYFTQDVGGSLEIRLDRLDGTRIALAKIDSIKSGFRAVAIPLVPTTGIHDLYFIFRNPSIDPQRSVNGVEWLAFRNDNFRDPGREREFMKLVNTKTDDTPIFIENGDEQHRKTQIFERGNWLVKGEEVQPATPQSLNPFPQDAPKNRLGLAQWLMAKDNPLTARTLVNRVWEQLFGAGLAETLEDLGTQGATPTHPELLDWLSLRVSNEHQWSIKKLMKDIVLSATYCQDSRVSKDKLEKDPSNKWLARGPRVRLSGEQVRDQALTVSGLLSDKMYGKSVMPYQPDGVWQSVWSDEKWVVSKGEDRYRRAIYTFQKRTSPYPSMMTFDGSSREVCQVRRIRTNTPLQSLVTLNDPVYLDAARALAKKMRAAGKSTEEQIKAGYSMIVFDEMSDEKLAALDKLYRESLSVYQSDAKLKSSFLKEGSAEEAAMTVVASALLNLDETITKG